MKSEFLKPLLSRLNSLLVYVSLLVFIGFQSCQVQDEFDETNSKNLKNATIQEGNSITYWGHETFTRSTGKPEVVKKKIGSADLIHFEPGFVLQLKNGDGTNNLVSSAIVKLDGKQIFGPSDFSKNVKELSKEITGLTEKSEIEVELRSGPESYLEIWIEGKLLPGHALITSEGGVFSLLNDEITLDFPEKAVMANVFISVKNIMQELPSNFKSSVVHAYDFSPDGLKFDLPIKVTINLKDNDLNNIPYYFGQVDLNSGYMILNPFEKQPKENNVFFFMEHFSIWATSSDKLTSQIKPYKYSIESVPNITPYEYNKYSDDSNEIGDLFKNEIRRSFKKWNAYGHFIAIEFEEGNSNESSIIIESLTRNEADEKYKTLSGDFPENFNGKVLYRLDNKKRVIVINNKEWLQTKYFTYKDYVYSNYKYNVERTMIHEIGHLFGLGEEYKLNKWSSFKSVMSDYFVMIPLSIMSYDIEEVKSIYNKNIPIGTANKIESYPNKEIKEFDYIKNQNVTDILQVIVKDKNDKPIPGVTVIYNCTQSNIKWESPVTYTNNLGIASLKSLQLPNYKTTYEIRAQVFAEKDDFPTDQKLLVTEINFKINVNETSNKGLIAYYPFNGNANDESGNGKNGTISGAVFSNDRNNKSNSSLFFDGSNDYVLVKPAILNSNTSFTACAWIKPQTIDEVRAIIWERSEYENDNCGNFSAGNWALEIYENKLCHDIASIDNSGTCKWDRVFYNSQISTGNWYFICSVYNKTDKTFKLYINGELYNSTLENSNLRTWAGAVTNIGRNTALVSNQYWHGNIDDIRIYNRPLTDQEIKSLYQE